MAAVAPSPKRIKVGVRLRPFTHTERVKAGGKAAWTWHERTIYQQIFPAQIPPRRAGGGADESKRGGSSTSSSSSQWREPATFPSSYSFDFLYPPSTKTQAVYDETVKDGVMAAMDGYHSSVFVYGQTGTGKTHTMQGTRADPGVIPLAVKDLFDYIARHPNVEFLLRFSYLEIYNERFYDLLAAGAKTDVKIYDVTRPTNAATGTSGSAGGSSVHAVKDVVLKGLREEIVVSPEHVLSLVEVGNLHRHVATTDANDQSSRSHVVFRMVIESQPKRPQTGVTAAAAAAAQANAPVRSATLNLIDLAGSESVRLANTSGHHAEEGKFINRSLLTLGHIIWKLSREQRKSGRNASSLSSSGSQVSHLPYRNSKLTRILQPALGGQAHIAIVCTCAPSVECLLETHGTLKFASRARRVKSRAAPNDGMGDATLLKKYRLRVRELEEQLETLLRRRRNSGGGPRSSGTQTSVNLATMDERRAELQFAIGNITRAILNSQTPRVEEPPAQEQAQAQTHPPLARRPTFMTSRSDSQNTSNKTLVGSGGSGSTKTLPLSSSSSRGLAELSGLDEEATETKDEDEPEHEEALSSSLRQPTPASAPATPRLSSPRLSTSSTGGIQQRPSLTALLMSKYHGELEQLEAREGRWRAASTGERNAQRELLREFVRGLEIAQAEQETRMSKIRELELANEQLQHELAGLKSGDDNQEAAR